MPKDEWGVKRICPHCSTRFYDLQHDPMTCPNCNSTFTVESLVVAKGKTLRPEKLKPEPVDLEDLPEIDADVETIDDSDDLDDEILEDEEDNVDLEDIADVGPEEEET
jgi:hypothetical protein